MLRLVQWSLDYGEFCIVSVDFIVSSSTCNHVSSAGPGTVTLMLEICTTVQAPPKRDSERRLGRAIRNVVSSSVQPKVKVHRIKVRVTSPRIENRANSEVCQAMPSRCPH